MLSIILIILAVSFFLFLLIVWLLYTEIISGGDIEFLSPILKSVGMLTIVTAFLSFIVFITCIILSSNCTHDEVIDKNYNLTSLSFNGDNYFGYYTSEDDLYTFYYMSEDEDKPEKLTIASKFIHESDDCTPHVVLSETYTIANNDTVDMLLYLSEKPKATLYEVYIPKNSIIQYSVNG